MPDKTIDAFIMWADRPNANRRIYPRDVLEKAINTALANANGNNTPVTDGLCDSDVELLGSLAGSLTLRSMLMVKCMPVL